MTRAVPDLDDARQPLATVATDHNRSKTGFGAMLVARRPGWVLPVLGVLVGMASLLVSSRSYFFADDFFYGDIMGSNALTIELLTRSWFGHLVPGFVLLDWVFYRTVGMNWLVASIIMAAVAAGATVAFVRCLDATIGRKHIATVVGAIFGLSIVVLFQSVWWGAVVTNVIPLAAGVSAIGCLTRWINTGRLRHLVALAMMFGLAVAFYEKSLLFAGYAGLWTILVLDAGQPVRERFRLVLRRWPAWLVIGAISSVVLLVYTRGGYAQELGVPGSTAQTGQFVVRGVALGLVPSIFGADLQQFPYLFGPEIMGIPVEKLALAFAAVTNLVLLIVLVLTVRADRRSWGPWTFAALAILINQVPLARARFWLSGADGGRLPRYQLDDVFILMATLGVVLTWYLERRRAVPAPVRSPGRRNAIIVCGAVGTLMCLTLWVLSGSKTIERSNGAASKIWNDNLAGSLPPEGWHLLEAPLPENLAFAVMYPYNLVSRVIPLLYPNVVVGAELNDGWVIGPDGTGGPAKFVASKVIDVTECSGPDGTIPPVALNGGSAEPSYLLIELTAETNGDLKVNSGPPGSLASSTRMESPIPIVPGKNSVIVLAPVDADLTMVSAGSVETGFCISRISVGQLST